MKRYIDRSILYEGLEKTFFFIEGQDNESNNSIRGFREYIRLALLDHGVEVEEFRTLSMPDSDGAGALAMRQFPTLGKEDIDEIVARTARKCRLLFVNETWIDEDGTCAADIICEEDFGTTTAEHAAKLNAMLGAIVSDHKTQYTLTGIRFRLPAREETEPLEQQDNYECLCNDLIAESMFGTQEIAISPIMFDEEYNITLPLYPQVEITLEPLPKSLYILFLHHPEGIILKDINQYSEELKNIYSLVSGRKNPTVINRVLQTLTDPTETPLHKNLSIIRKCFTSQLNYSIARNYIPAHGRKKAHCIPLESEYVILPGIA